MQMTGEAYADRLVQHINNNNIGYHFIILFLLLFYCYLEIMRYVQKGIVDNSACQAIDLSKSTMMIQANYRI